MIGSHLLRYQTDQVYCLLDTETSGLNLFYSLPWQVAWVVFRGNEILERGDHMIHWDNLHVSPESARISHFNASVYASKARPAGGVLKELETHILNPHVRAVGHNIFFDAQMHLNWRRELGLPEDRSWTARMIDMNALAKALKKGWSPDHTNLYKWQTRVANFRAKGLKTNMAQSCRDFDIEFRDDKAHDAAYDVDRNMILFNKLIRSVEI